MELKTRKCYQDPTFRQERLEQSAAAGISCGATGLATRKYRPARQTANGAESLTDANVCAFAHFPFPPCLASPRSVQLEMHTSLHQYRKLLDIAIHDPRPLKVYGIENGGLIFPESLGCRVQ